MNFKNCDLVVNQISTINNVSGACTNPIKVSIPVSTVVKGYAGQTSIANMIQFNPALPSNTLVDGDIFELYSNNNLIASGTIQKLYPYNSYEFI